MSKLQLSSLNFVLLSSKKAIRLFVFFVCLFFVSIHAKAATKIASVTGNWNATATWGGVAIPTTGDVIIINSGVTVTVNVTTSSVASITINAAGVANGISINSGVILNVSGAITLNAPTATLSSTLSVGSGTLSAGSIAIAGSTTSGRNAIVSVSTGTINVTGNITFSGTAAQAKLTFTGSGNLNIGGSIGMGGTFTASTGTVNYNNLGVQTINAYTYYNLTLSGSGDKTLSAATTISNNLYIGSNTRLIDNQFQITGNTTGVLTIENNATLFLGQIAQNGTIFTVFPTNYTKAHIDLQSGSTVQYNSWVSQPISTVPDYYNVECQYPGTKTVASGTLTINGFFETASPLDLGTNDPTINLAGDFNLLAVGAAISLTSGVFSIQGNFNNTLTSGGSITTSNGTVVFNGSSAQEITGTGNVATPFYNLTINNTSGGVTNTITGSNLSISVANVLTMTSGILTTSTSNLLNVINTATTAIAGGTASSYINGPVNWTLKSSMASGSTYSFPIGKGGNYYPFSLVNPTTGTGTITAKVEAFNSNCGGISNFTIPNTLSTIGGLSSTEYWSLVTSGSFTNSSISITRPTLITPFDVIAGSNNATGTYSSLVGTATTNGISSSSAIGSNRFFTFGKINGIRIKGSLASSFCAGSNVTVNFEATGTYLSGNIFTAQLSDALGSFSSPTAIGTLSLATTTGGTYAINATIPINTAAGSGYRIRVVASSPIVMGSDNGSGITINPNLPASVIIAATATTICSGSSVTFTTTPTNGGVPSYQWSVNGIAVPGENMATFTSSSLANNDVVTVAMTSNASPCLTGSPAISNSITMVVLSKPAKPTVGIVVPQTCTVIKGSITLNNLPSGNWTLTQTGTTNSSITGTGTSITITGLSIGTYAYTVTNANGCTSLASNNATISGMVTTTWNGASWSYGIPNADMNIVFSGAYTSNGSLTGCSCTINSGAIIINSNDSLVITKDVNASGGSLTFENNASLIQIDNNAINTGNITYKRNASIKQYDYVYWSSPVSGFNINNLSLTQTSGPKYIWNPTIANGNGGQGNWTSAEASVMSAGNGYIVRAPSSFTSTPSTFAASFVGIPNNGTIPVSVSRGTITGAPITGTNGTQITNLSDNWNLIGNPYPSSIRANQFLIDNQSIIEGSIRLWTHGTSPSSTVANPFYSSFSYNYTPSDYLTYNFTGTTAGPVAVDELFIGAGQGFFVQMLEGPAAAANVNFNNTLRSNTYSNSIFYKSNTANATATTEKNRIWLDIINSNNESERTLIGYVDGATNSKDNLFDASYNVSNSIAIYSLIDSDKMNIQGKALPFNDNDIVPIGINVNISGSCNIAIGDVDGLFNNQNIYIEDTYLNIIHDLKQSPYSFSSAVGVFNDRFKLRYTNNNLSNSTFENVNSIAFIANNKLKVQAYETISKIELYDITGKLIKVYESKNNANSSFESDFEFAKGVYIISVKLYNGTTFKQKVIN